MLLLQTQKSYVVHNTFLRHILDGDASGFHGAYKLINVHHSVTFLKIFLHLLISQASKYNMCKFYQIASNSLQVIQIVHELFDCPSYMQSKKIKFCMQYCKPKYLSITDKNYKIFRTQMNMLSTILN